ncbi:MAG: hypothetical protein LBI82_08370, partial [Dysgonamonadaceae bacterium]|nr:hypothetical protein [Dysgonamonadaceae bacterium]
MKNTMTTKNSKESRSTKSPPFGGIRKGLLNFKWKAAVIIMIVLNAVMMTAAAQTLTWVINPADVNVSRIGSSGHVLKLSNLDFGGDKIPTSDGSLDVTYLTGQTAGGSRRIVAWTDLSGNIGEIEDFTFASPA